MVVREHTKRLLLINSRFMPVIGGGETYVLELMDYFSSIGWEVHLATNDSGEDKPRHWRDCAIHYVQGFDDNCQSIKLCAPALRKILTDISPDVVHIHNIMPFFVYSSIVGSAEFATVLTIHNTPHIPERLFGTFNDYEAEKTFTKQLFSNGKYDALIFGSNYYLSAYAEAAPWIEKNDMTKVIHYFPPSVTSSEINNEVSVHHDGVNILFPSRILKRKGIEDALKVVSQLPVNFRLILPSFHSCENEQYKVAVIQRIHALNLVDRVVIPREVVLPEMMPKYYKQADIVLIPSHYEGFGIVAVEAMSWGVPVVASATGGLSEIIDDNKNGIIISPKNVGAFKGAILQLINDKVLRDNIVAAGYETVKDKFNRADHMQQIEDIYHEISR